MSHTYAEAFCLMWYACEGCCHRELIWNSRDGITPFATVCPSCGEPSLRHTDWPLDRTAVDHRLHPFQKFWRDGTPDEAEAIIRKRVEQSKHLFPISDADLKRLVQSCREGKEGEFQRGWPMLDQQRPGVEF